MNEKALIEAALFVSEKPLTLENLCKVLGIGKRKTLAILTQLQHELEKDEHGIELIKTPEGYELIIKSEYRDRVAPFAPLADLSEGMKRTLAIVAVKQPVKQSLIVKYQGNKAYDYIKKLEKRGLIKTEKFGRTKLLYTTSEFEKYFGKKPEEIREMLKKKVGREI